MKIIALYLLITSFIGLIFGIINRIKTGERDIVGYTAFMPYLLIKFLFNIRILSLKNLYLHTHSLDRVNRFEDNIFITIKRETEKAKDTQCIIRTYEMLSKRFNLYVEVENDTDQPFRSIYKDDLVKSDDLESLFHSLKATTKFNL